jgi:hypothetical protein
MGFLQQFHLIIKYNKGNTNNLVHMLSSPPTPRIIYLVTLMHMDPVTHEKYKKKYTNYDDYKEIF